MDSEVMDRNFEALMHELAETKALREKLRDEPFFWSRLGFCYDPPRAGADGKQIIFSREFDEYNRIHRAFADAGVKYHTTILHSGWVGVDRYDYTLTDEVLDALFKGNPDIYYMPRVKLNVPPDWCRENPSETFVYFHGPRTKEEIAALAETPKHDYLGMESAGYAVNGGKGIWKDDRPNYGGLIGLQSFASRKWLLDASTALWNLLKHLSESPYADRIIGVHIAYGMCGETHPHGLWAAIGDGRRGDYGIKAQIAFRSWGVQKYGSAEARDAVWGDALLPDPWSRECPAATLDELFCDENSKLHDYFEFVSDFNVEAIETFCQTVKASKELFGHPMAAGVFYGYMYLPQSPNAGHLGFERILSSEWVDFLSSPKGYYRCMPGDPGGEQGPSESVARRRVWLDEIDNHTHLDRREAGRAANEFESKTLLWREAVKNLTHGQGFWWMDLGEGWYDLPALMGEIAAISDMQKRLGAPGTSAAEVLLVVDEHALTQMKISYGLNSALMYELHSELKLIGAPVDTLRLADLADADLSRYKMVVFTNCFRVMPEERAMLAEKLGGKLSVWHYASGILAPEYDPANFTALTGFTLREIPRPDDSYWGYESASAYANSHKHITGDFPLFTVETTDADEVILTHPDGTANCVLRGDSCICCTPALTRGELRELAKRAGVRILCDADCTVYADDRVAGYFPKNDFAGEITLPDRTKHAVEIAAHGMAVFEKGAKIR